MRYARVPVKQAVISPSALSLMYPDQEFPVIRARSLSMIFERARDRDSPLLEGAHKVQVDFTEGRLAIKIDPSGNLLQSLIDLNNLALADSPPKIVSASACIPALARTPSQIMARKKTDAAHSTRDLIIISSSR